MMKPIKYVERTTRERLFEKVYGGAALNFLYGGNAIGNVMRRFITEYPLCSSLYGRWMKSSVTHSLIVPFIKKFDVDVSEFADSVESFRCFNDFFIRKLKPDCRPITQGKDVAVIPADGRYYFYPDIDKADGFVVKGKKFSLEKLLGSSVLAEKYRGGAMVMARLCPIDYHRFHFPCSCTPGESQLINGYLYSVNPIAVKENIEIYSENKRMLTSLHTEAFGDVLYLEVGATNVGGIIQTYEPQHDYKCGDEKGYFDFGASALIILFEKGRITFADDLLELGGEGIEIRCLMGQKLGVVA